MRCPWGNTSSAALQTGRPSGRRLTAKALQMMVAVEVRGQGPGRVRMKIIQKMGDGEPLYPPARQGTREWHLFQLICELAEGGIYFRSLTEAEADTTTLMGKAFYGIVAGFAHAAPGPCRWTHYVPSVPCTLPAFGFLGFSLCRVLYL